jgi:methylmalonyl-CoA/ethylmalonyl-CoA epimerase
MSGTRIEFRRFHHVAIGVPDFDAAVADWTDRLAWPPSSGSAPGATFALDDSYVELLPVAEVGAGVTLVSVVVDDIEAAADRLTAKGVPFSLSPDNHLTVDPAAINGVPMELRPEHPDRVGVDRAREGRGGPYRRFNHIVVAVADDEAARASWADLFGQWNEQPGHAVEAVHHVPVGIAWFGLTGSGTDATALARFVERRGEGVYGLALVVDEHPETIASLEKRGAQIIRQESSGQTFVHPKTSHGILIDLVPERHPSRLAVGHEE